MRRHITLGAGVAAALVLAACGGGDDETTTGGSASDGDLREITIGMIPIVDVAPIYLGVEQGFFADEGLQLNFEMAQGGAAIVPAVISGQYEFGFSNTVSLMLAQTQGIDVPIVTAGSSSTGDPEADFGAILVGPDSDIESVEDLAGRTVAINTLNNINDTLIRQAIDEAGGDADTVEFVEIGHPDMISALEQGSVDAIWEVEPFLTIARDGGAQDVFALYAEVVDDLTVATYFTSGEIYDNDPELVEAFQNAAARSFEYATENPDETRAIISEYTSIDEDVLDRLTLPAFPSEINDASVEEVAELSARWGLFAEDDVDLERLLP